MTALVESLKRLYNTGKVDYTKLEKLLIADKITVDQLEYILNNETETSTSI